jgi:hypothetical protein
LACRKSQTKDASQHHQQGTKKRCFHDRFLSFVAFWYSNYSTSHRTLSSESAKKEQKATPLAKEAWGLSNQMTARALDAIGKNGGPRCCKRDSYLAIIEAVRFTEERLSVKMEIDNIACSRSHLNNHCIQAACPFN